MVRKIHLPLTDETLSGLNVRDRVLLSGGIYVARDAAHKRMIESLDRSESLPFCITGQVIYYMGPSPARPDKIIGAAGPTTSGRMDTYSPRLMAEGLKGMIGKGMRSQAVKEAIKKYRVIYLATIGGAGALLSGCIKKSEVIAYEDLGAEAIRRLELEDFPAVVANDIFGGDIYQEGRIGYRVDRS
ncbi:Fe-S-containing hydro-lyase [Chloroflexota bacterium]